MPKLFYIGVKAAIFVDNKCLIVKNERSDRPFWDLPGGRMEEAESVEQTLDRELREELPSLKSYRVERLLGYYPHRKNWADDRGLFFIVFKVVAEPFDVRLSGEHTDYRWVRKDELETLKDGLFAIPPHYDAILKAFD